MELEEKIDELEGQIKGFKVITDSLKDGVKSLKIQNGKTKSRISILENLGLQDQIFNLSERIGLLENNLLTLSRNNARYNMDSLHAHMQDALNTCSKKVPVDVLKRKLLAEFTADVETVMYSPEPIKVTDEFRQFCIDMSNAWGLDSFIK